MFRNYIKVAWRNAFNQKGYSFINIAGLSLGIAISVCIFLYVRYELSYDTFHENYDRIYRLSLNAKFGSNNIHAAVVSPPMGDYLVQNYAGAESFTRLYKQTNSGYFRNRDRKFYEKGLIYADSGFFRVFSFKMIKGNEAEALKEPNSLVLTQTAARKYFGDGEAYGKTLVQNDNKTYRITGIVKDPPENSHFHFNMLGAFADLEAEFGKAYFENWGAFSFHTYILLAEGVDPKGVEAHFPEMISKNMPRIAQQNYEVNPYLQKLGNIHLHSKLMMEIEPTGDFTRVIIFAAIAGFILLIACINFMNLASARSFKRSREVAMRKVHGAEKKQLITQFMGESVFFTVVSLLLALVLVELFLPLFSDIVDKNLQLAVPGTLTTIMMLAGLTLVTAFLSGSYPALYLSSFSPMRIFNNETKQGKAVTGFRNILVVLQFAISIFLIISSLVIYDQIKYVSAKDLGYNHEHTIFLNLNGTRQQKNYQVYKKEFSKLACVAGVAGSSHSPGRGLDGNSFIPEGMDEKDPWLIYYFGVDPDFKETLGMKMVMGRDLSHEYATDSSAVVINRTLYKKLGWEDPLGRKLKVISDGQPRDYTIVGVVEDFHAQSLHEGIEPMMLMYSDSYSFLNIRLRPGDLKKDIAQIEKKWNEMEPDVPFSFEFIDQAFEATYRADLITARLFIFFTVVAIFIACLGLLGLTAFMVGRRKKEIGIRKVLGAPVTGIVLLLGGRFSRWVLVANLIAWPAAWLVMNRWLENFAYRTSLNWLFFVLAALVALLIAWITVSYQTIKSARMNPVDVIRYE